METIEVFKVFKRDIAFRLISRGYRLLDKQPNREKPYFNVYLFEDTEQFRKDFTELQHK